MWFYRTHSYSGVPSDENKPWPSTAIQTRTSVGKVFLVIVCFVAGALGFWITEELSRRHGNHSLELETIPHMFQYNRSFSYPPSNHTNKAWREIFPAEGGFFVHPTIAPSRSTFSVFHQLHCLNGLRGAYWASHHFALSGQKLKDEDLPVDIQESHMRHCIDLLRQALMCHGDTTLEVVDEKINGVHGFRVEHQCKNWEQLKDWTSAQQAIQHVEQIV